MKIIWLILQLTFPIIVKAGEQDVIPTGNASLTTQFTAHRQWAITMGGVS